MKKLNRNILSKVCMGSVLVLGLAVAVNANSNVTTVKADSYVYDFWKNVIPSAEGLTYKETYYFSDIYDAETNQISLSRFDSLYDMEVYDSTIYLLDARTASTTPIALKDGSVTVQEAGVSQVIIINQDFRYTAVLDEFLITDEVREKLDEYYHFGHWSGLAEKDQIELNEIGQAQLDSTELVDVLNAADETKAVKKNANDDNKIFASYDTFAYNENRGSSIAFYAGDRELTESQYNITVVSAINVSYLETNTSAKNSFSTAELTKTLNNLGVEVITSYSETSKQEDVREVSQEIKLAEGTAREFTALQNDALKDAACKVTVNFLDQDLTADQYEINTEEGTIIITDSSLISEQSDGTYTIKYKFDLGEKDFIDTYVLFDSADKETASKACKAAGGVTPTTMDLTYVTFDGVSEGTEVRAIFKYVEAEGRAPYLPYSKDATKAAVRLKNASGITVTEDYIYIADTDNYRILKIRKSDYVVEDVILSPADSAFYQVYDTEYKCKDSKLGTAYVTIKQTNDYYNTNLADGVLTFRPRKIAVKSSGVCYCVADSAYYGLLEFGVDGVFNRYLGKNLVTVSAIRQLWKNIWSETQLASSGSDLPSYFNNISVASDDFLYATSDPDEDATSNLNLVKIINTKGNDILKRNGYVTPDGDAVYETASTKEGVVLGSSLITSVAISEIGNFTITDKRRGRLFTYDAEGNLLYVTGNQPGGTEAAYSGSKSDSIVNPIACDYLYRTYVDENDETVREETLIVLDQASNTILLFETTEFGQAVNTATDLYQNGKIKDTYLMQDDSNYIILDKNGNYTVIDEEGTALTGYKQLYTVAYDSENEVYNLLDSTSTLVASVAKDDLGEKILISEGAENYWRKVIKMNTNYELAYLGLGKALNRNGQYQEAMKYFKLAHNAQYYSKAYSSYRDIVLSESFNWIMALVIALVVVAVVSKVSKTIIANNEKEAKKGENK